jgi:hypothetical protein
MTSSVTPIGAVRIPGSDLHYAAGMKAGNWVFLTGIEAVDFDTGLHPAVAGNPALPYHGLPKHRREGDFICARLGELLDEAGTSFANTVRLDQYYPTWKAVDPYHLSRHAAFGTYIPPSTSVIMEELLTRGADITASVLAVVPGGGREPKRVPTPQVTAPVWSGFVPAVTSGDFVFIAGQMARAASGDPDPRAHVPPQQLVGRLRDPAPDGVPRAREARAGFAGGRRILRRRGEGAGLPAAPRRHAAFPRRMEQPLRCPPVRAHDRAG